MTLTYWTGQQKGRTVSTEMQYLKPSWGHQDNLSSDPSCHLAAIQMQANVLPSVRDIGKLQLPNPARRLFCERSFTGTQLHPF